MAEKIKFDLEIDGSQAQESIKGVGDEMKDLKKMQRERVRVSIKLVKVRRL